MQYKFNFFILTTVFLNILITTIKNVNDVIKANFDISKANCFRLECINCSYHSYDTKHIKTIAKST